MIRRLPTLIALALLAGLYGGGAAHAATGVAPARGFVPRQLIVKFEGQRFGRAIGLPPRVGVRLAAAALNRSPGVAYAAPNYLATASTQLLPADGIPNDPGALFDPLLPGAWVTKQWNFLPWEGVAIPELPISAGGIDAVGAWKNLIAVQRRGAKGITVAVLDTGIAYRNKEKRFRRSPDFSSGQFTKGYDFVTNSALPLDRNGHGTHVAGTIAEKTNNGIGLTGLAYRAKLMPVRVLDRQGSGDADDIARGIRFAVKHRADVINMSFNFECGKSVPGIDEALRFAYENGVVAVASVGNLGSETCVSPPATSPHVIGVGGTTQGGCLGNYSLEGDGVDLVAPGGGTPASGCLSVLAGSILQVTFEGSNPRQFDEPGGYVGTSMAAAHVSGVAALVLASGTIDPKKNRGRVGAVTRRLRATARDLGLPTTQQGAGLIDAGRATDPGAY
ncbi:MAG TPA: S8 family serine peptidase [Solirubrobacterales bacterium]